MPTVNSWSAPEPYSPSPMGHHILRSPRPWGNLGIALKDLGELDAARTNLEQSLAIFEITLGPDHPDVATTLSDLGVVYLELDDLPTARAAVERSLATFKAVYEPDHPAVARTQQNLDIIQRRLDERAPGRLRHRAHHHLQRLIRRLRS